MCQQFIYDGLTKGESAVFIVSGEPLDILLSSMASMGRDLSKFKEKVFFVDLYSWRVQLETKNVQGYKRVRPNDLNELNKEVNDICASLKGKRWRVAWDSLSDALLYNEPASVFKFMQLMVAQLRSRGGVGMVVLEEGLHLPAQRTTLEYIIDNVIEMRVDQGKRFMRVKKAAFTNHVLNWIEYFLEQGVELRVSPLLS